MGRETNPRRRGPKRRIPKGQRARLRIRNNIGRRMLRPTANKPSVHLFKRTMTETLALSNVVAPVGWTAEGNAIYRNFEFKLNDLHDATDFTALFAQYKLCGVRQELIFSNNTTDDDNSQMLIYWDTNRSGQNETGTESRFLDSQTSKHRVLKPPGGQVKLYTKLSQLSNTFKLTDDDYAVVKPRYISTAEPNTPHYGNSMRIQRVDDLPFGSNLDRFQTLKILTTVYIACKKVQ